MSFNLVSVIDPILKWEVVFLRRSDDIGNSEVITNHNINELSIMIGR